MRAKTHFRTVSQMNAQNLRGGYEARVKERKDLARMTGEYTKKLEMEEA